MPDGGRRSSAEPPDAAVDISMLSGLISFHLRMLGLEVNRACDRAFAGTPIAGGTGKLTTLLLVARNPGISQTDVARTLSKDRAAMVRIVDHLEQAGLLVRRTAQAERRRNALHLTERGRRDITRYMATALRYDADFFRVLSAAERASLIRMLKKLRAAYQSQTLGAGE